VPYFQTRFAFLQEIVALVSATYSQIPFQPQSRLL